MAHYVSLIYGNRRAAASEIDQRHTVLHLQIRKYGLSCRFSSEIFLLRGDACLDEQVVGILEVSLSSDEYLEVSLKHVAGHADDVVLDDLEIFSIRERLRNRSIYGLMCGIFEWVCLLSEPLYVIDVLCSDFGVFASVDDLAAVGFLPDRELRHADNGLVDLDSE